MFRKESKKRILDSNLAQAQSELNEAMRRERLIGERVQHQADEDAILRAEVADNQEELCEFRRLLKRAFGSKAAM